MNTSLKERALSYETALDPRLTRRLPVVIVLNGRGFKKTLSLLEKPFSEQYLEVMSKTLIVLASEIEGCSFIYSYNDEIVIISQNDNSINTEAWYDNNLQKLVSVSAAVASVSFYKLARDTLLPLVGSPLFLSKAFVLPDSMEVANYLIHKQHQASQAAITQACMSFLLKTHDMKSAEDILQYKTNEEKFDFMVRDCNINLKQYPAPFWKGIACYRSPKMIKNAYGEEELRNKLSINSDLPLFSKKQDFILDIIDPIK